MIYIERASWICKIFTVSKLISKVRLKYVPIIDRGTCFIPFSRACWEYTRYI